MFKADDLLYALTEAHTCGTKHHSHTGKGSHHPHIHLLGQLWRLEVRDESAGRIVSSEPSILGLQMAIISRVLTWSFVCMSML